MSDPELVKALLHDARESCGLVLTLMERVLHLDPEKESREISILKKQVGLHLPETQIRIENLRKAIDPWPDRRGELSRDLGEEIDRFFVSLDRGLEGLQSQTSHRMTEVEGLLAQVQKEIKGLRVKSSGLQGYRGRIDVNPYLLNRKI
jgi:hypothetical protein